MLPANRFPMPPRRTKAGEQNFLFSSFSAPPSASTQLQLLLFNAQCSMGVIFYACHNLKLSRRRGALVRSLVRLFRLKWAEKKIMFTQSGKKAGRRTKRSSLFYAVLRGSLFVTLCHLYLPLRPTATSGRCALRLKPKAFRCSSSQQPASSSKLPFCNVHATQIK